jgi:hypothetical protein
VGCRVGNALGGISALIEAHPSIVDKGIRMKPSPTSHQFLICHVAQLDDIRGREAWRNRHRRGELVLQIPSLTAAENNEWTDRLNSTHRACGCPTSAVGMMAGLGGYLSFIAVTKGFSSSGWLEAGIGFVVVLAATGLGKFLGLSWARIRFNQKLNALVAATAPKSAARRE